MPKRLHRLKKSRSGAIPTDSFSDIAFLLIIYFLVATTWSRSRPSPPICRRARNPPSPRPTRHRWSTSGAKISSSTTKKLSLDELNERLSALPSSANRNPRNRSSWWNRLSLRQLLQGPRHHQRQPGRGRHRRGREIIHGQSPPTQEKTRLSPCRSRAWATSRSC